MDQNRLPSQPEPTQDFRIEQVLCKELGQGMVKVAIATQKQISGQVAIEGDEEKLVALFSAFPNGDLIVWFLDKGQYNLMALVNQKFRHVASFPMDRQSEFQESLTAMEKVLGK